MTSASGRETITFMLCALAVVMLAVATPETTFGQAVGVLRIKIVLLDAAKNPMPVPRHALLVSENPVAAPPRRIVTGTDGTAELKLRPGNYTVESDRPVTFLGKAYEWTQIVDIVAGRDAVLELTADNAAVEPAVAEPTAAAAAPENDPAFLETEWRDSVLAVWTPTAQASGFVIDATGDANRLIVTNQRAIGGATSVEVQVTRTVKLAATVLAADPARDVAVLRADAKALASIRPVPLRCEQSMKSPVAVGQEVFALGVSLDQRKRMSSATISRVDGRAMVADMLVGTGSTGGPAFNAAGELIGITSLADEKDVRRHGDVDVVRAVEVCAVLSSAADKMKTAAAAGATHLPVEPVSPFPLDALKAVAERRAGGLSPYQMSSSTFDVSFITPVLLYAAHHPPDRASGAGRAGSTRVETDERMRPLVDFSNWSEYVGGYPPVLLVRVTPRLVEGFWTTVARGAARTQGVSIPPIKRIKSGFSRLRAFCGVAEVTPIHPFKIEQRVSETEAIHEGLYVFDPGALGPECGTVKLELYSDKEPDKAETRVVDAKLIQQVWEDFAAYRAVAR